jgi:microsomal dipeptidase-like Zn-dependent dipeptidase
LFCTSFNMFLRRYALLNELFSIQGNSYVRANNVEMALASIVRKENPTWNEEQITPMIPTLHAQLQDQVAKGDLTVGFLEKKNVWPAVTSSKFQLYKRVQQEIQIIQALQNQRLREQFYQQQALRMFQQQQMAAAMKMHNSGKLVS